MRWLKDKYQSDKVNSIIMSCITYTTMAHVHDDTKVWGSFVKLAKQRNIFCHLIEYEYAVSLRLIGHVINIPTMQFFTGISRHTQSKSYMLSLTKCLGIPK